MVGFSDNCCCTPAEAAAAEGADEVAAAAGLLSVCDEWALEAEETLCGACVLPLAGAAGGVGSLACVGVAGVVEGSVGLLGVCLRLKANCAQHQAVQFVVAHTCECNLSLCLLKAMVSIL